MSCIGIVLILVAFTQNEPRIDLIICGAFALVIGLLTGFICFQFRPFLEYSLDDQLAAEYESRLNSWKRIMSSKGK